MNGRELKKGDTFMAVNLVDMAVSLFTLGVPFYDPARPYIYQVLGGKRLIRFHFEMTSSIAGVGSTKSLMLLWKDAEKYHDNPSLMSICKRVVWERRWLLREVNAHEYPEMHIRATGYRIVRSVKTAVIAWALGFERPSPCIITDDREKVFVVGDKVPPWLAPFCESLDDLTGKVEEGVSFIEAPANAVNPIAVASAMFINAVAWFEHLRSDKPFMQFTTATGKSYWVKEGSERWRELLALGYSPG